MKKNKDIQFTAGITYQEHLIKAEEIFETVVKPQVKQLKKIANKDNRISKYTLSAAQKAHLNCQSPI